MTISGAAYERSPAGIGMHSRHRRARRSAEGGVRSPAGCGKTEVRPDSSAVWYSLMFGLPPPAALLDGVAAGFLSSWRYFLLPKPGERRDQPLMPRPMNGSPVQPLSLSSDSARW